MELTRRSVLGVGAATLAAPRATNDGGDDWSLPVGDRHNTGYAAVAGPTGGLRADWRRSFDREITAPPTHVDGYASLGLDDGRVVGVATDTGDVTASTSIGARPKLLVSSTPDTLYVPAADEHVYAVRRADGTVRWRRAIGEALAAPITAADGDVLVGGQEGAIVSIDAASGRPQWTATMPSAVQTPPALVGDTVVVRDSRGLVVSLDIQSGDERWRLSYRTGSIAGFKGPAVRHGRVYVEGHPTSGASANATAAEQRQLVALDAESGQPAWRRTLGGDLLFLVAGPERLYASLGGVVMALDPADGSVLWRHERDDVRVSLSGAADALYATTRNTVDVYDPATGEIRAHYDPNGGLLDDGETAITSGAVPIAGGAIAVEDRQTLVGIRGGAGTELLTLAGGGGLIGLLAYAAWRRRSRRKQVAGDEASTEAA